MTDSKKKPVVRHPLHCVARARRNTLSGYGSRGISHEVCARARVLGGLAHLAPTAQLELGRLRLRVLSEEDALHLAVDFEAEHAAAELAAAEHAATTALTEVERLAALDAARVQLRASEARLAEAASPPGLHGRQPVQQQRIVGLLLPPPWPSSEDRRPPALPHLIHLGLGYRTHGRR